jgi:hypothetical protein
MLLVVVLRGAEPIFDGGGELALDIGADVVEALSVISLAGVPGRSCLDIDARLGWREGGNGGACIDVADDGVVTASGASALGVDATRNIFAGPPRDIGDCKGAAGSVLADNGGKAEELMAEFAPVSGTADTDFPGTEIFARPGGGRFSLGLIAGRDTGELPGPEFGVFLFTVIEGAALIGLPAFVEETCGVGFVLLLSRAGKSSSWRVDGADEATEDCEAIVFERPVAAADIFISCFGIS